MYIIRFRRILKTHSENSEKLERFVQLRFFIRIPKKHFYRLEKSSKLPFSFPPLFQTIMGKSLGHFRVSRAFSNLHRSNPSPHPTNNVGRVYPEFFPDFQLFIGRTARKFPKGCTVLIGNREMTEKLMNTAVLSQGLLSRIVGFIFKVLITLGKLSLKGGEKGSGDMFHRDIINY